MADSQCPFGRGSGMEGDPRYRCILQVDHPEEDHDFQPVLVHNGAGGGGLTDGGPINVTFSETLAKWWERTGYNDFLMFGPKLAEYGARDLVAHGRAIAEMGHFDKRTEAEYGEIGCMFYLHGKLARAMEAYARGDDPSEDTLHDITVYSQMARAFRERGKLSD